MLFTDEELEKTQPVFSEPRKVQPKTDDEMAWRIKNMLGEYFYENESNIDDSMELEAEDDEVASLHSLKFDSCIKSFHPNDFQEKLTEDNVIMFNNISSNSNELNIEKKGDDQSDLLNSKETINQYNESCQNSSGASSISSHRCSLKRQCKERISLLDDNPMFAVKTKRAKLNPSSKVKSSESSDIPTLKKCSEIQLPDNLSEVSNQGSPPLLRAMLTPLPNFSSPYENGSVNDISVNFESSKFNSKNIKSSSLFLETSSHQAQMQAKKQAKKRNKKKDFCESLPVLEASTSPTSAQNSNSVDAKIGSCQLNNGIIKIRLSKLPDNKKDLPENNYEVSFCESDALKKCKILSVPLSPLSPEVYSAYCISSKMESLSSSKSAIKDKSGQEILPETEVDNSINSPECVYLDTLNLNKKPEIDENLDVNILSADITENSESSKYVKDFFIENIETTCTNESVISQSENADIVLTENPVSNEEEEITATNMENETKPQTPIIHCETYYSKIMCSINLSLINRLPERANVSKLTLN